MNAETQGFSVQPRCPVCSQTILLELCDPSGAAICARCGHLLRWFRQRYNWRDGANAIELGTRLADDLGADSLDIVELVMELEEEFGVGISDADADQIETIADAIRCVEVAMDGQGIRSTRHVSS